LGPCFYHKAGFAHAIALIHRARAPPSVSFLPREEAPAWIDALRGANAMREEEARRAAERYSKSIAPVSLGPSGAVPDSGAYPMLVLVCIASYVAWELMNSWARLAAPYKWVTLYYYGLVALPLKGFAAVWEYLTRLREVWTPIAIPP
jgi:hypothetical protein